MFDKTCLAPQVVFMAVGVNDCIRQESAKDAAQHIIDTVKIIKDYSPDTQVIVQRVLPTSYPIKKFEGTDWEDQKLHDCAKTINEEVEDWIDDNKQHCISQVDMSSVVLDNGEFKDHVYEDGLHFGEDGDMKLYCRAIRKAISDYDNTRVSARGTALDWEDVEPFFYEGLENDNEYYRWAYNEWSSCPMGCGTQRRTAECHLMQVNGTDRVVPDSYCVDSFMNPLERMCNMTDSCLANIQGPRGALIKEPNTLLLSNLQSGNLLLEPNECPKLNTTSKVLLACCALLIGALAFAIVCMIMVLRSIKPSAEEYGHAEKGAEETLNKGGCKQKVQVMVSSSSDGAICDVQSGTSLQP